MSPPPGPCNTVTVRGYVRRASLFRGHEFCMRTMPADDGGRT